MTRIVLLLLAAAFAVSLIQCTNSSAKAPAGQVIQTYQLRLQVFRQSTDALLLSLQQQPASYWQQAFHQSRLAYKHLEWLADYYFPGTAKAINGPPVTEVEPDEPEKETEPTGFQVMEEWLFPQPDTTAQEALVAQARILQSLAQRLQNGLASLRLSDSHVLDAIRLHLLRISSMGLAGADNGIAQNSISEAAISLQSMRSFLLPYEPQPALTGLLNKAVAFLETDTAFSTFNRAAFLVQFARPLWHQLYLLQTERQIPFITETGLVNTTSPYLFDSLFFNRSGFAASNEADHPAVVQLGHRLFMDPRLSGNGRRSCASCHQPQKGYANNLAKNRSVDGKTDVFRNTPTIVYAALQPEQFADSRLSFLEDQARAVIEDHSEMKGDLKKLAAALGSDTAYRQLSQKAFGRTGLKEEDITQALAAFIRSQAPFSSPFDEYLRGKETALHAAAIKGFNLFMGKAKCGTCHFMPLFNGVVPPHFTKMESEVIGVPRRATAPFALDPDEGKARFTGAAVHRFAFKTPTLRNVALTAPYMHNGVYRTLEEVIDFYDKGGAAGFGITIDNQTLPAEPLNLTNEEKNSLIHFLHALTDK